MISLFLNYKEILFESLGMTVLLTVISLIFAFILGLFFGIMNVSKNRILNIIGTIYVDGIRSVPLIVVAYFIYLGVPYGIQSLGYTDFRLTAFVAGTIALSLNAGAYMAEIFRAGIQSVDKGQMEAARSLGLGYGKTMQRVILPQAIRTMIPSIINQFIISLKDTSILSVIGLQELTKAGSIIMGNTFQALGTWALIAIFYIVVIISLSRVAKVIERRLNVGNLS